MIGDDTAVIEYNSRRFGGQSDFPPINAIEVSSNLRDRGLGTVLFGACMELLRDRHNDAGRLLVYSTRSSEDFYEKIGVRRVFFENDFPYAFDQSLPVVSFVEEVLRLFIGFAGR